MICKTTHRPIIRLYVHFASRVGERHTHRPEATESGVVIREGSNPWSPPRPMADGGPTKTGMPKHPLFSSSFSCRRFEPGSARSLRDRGRRSIAHVIRPVPSQDGRRLVGPGAGVDRHDGPARLEFILIVFRLVLG